MPRRPQPPLRTAALRVALAVSLGTCPGRQVMATPSERDVAYELGVQQQDAGDHLRAAASFERAYRLTPATETGPRLLFLRASVAARLRAFDGSAAATAHLCQARDLLREHLSEKSGEPADALAEERASLERVEQLAGAGGCGEPAPDEQTAAPQRPATPDGPAAAATQPAPEGPAPAPAVARPPPTRGRDRGLLVAGAVSLGVGAVSLAAMGGGIALARAANRRGEALCRQSVDGCEANGAAVRDVLADGRLGDRLTAAGAVIGGLGVLAGVVLLALRGRASARLTLAPAWHGAAISGRF